MTQLKTVADVTNQRKENHSKVKADEATFGQIVKEFTYGKNVNNHKPKMDPHREKSLLRRARQLIVEVSERNIIDFIRDLNDDFKQNPDFSQQKIWDICSKHLCSIMKKLDHLSFLVIQGELENIPNQELKTTFLEIKSKNKKN